MKSYDAVIVGGGIIGGSIAFELARRNLRVVVLDRQELMREASWAAAGMLSPAPDCPAAIPLVPLARASLALYPQFIGAVEEASALRSGYHAGGALEVIFHGDAERELSTLVALHRGLGLACEPLALDDAQKMEAGLGRDARAAAFLPDECSVEPRALAAAVLAAAGTAGAELRPGVAVTSLAPDGKTCVGVKTSGGETIHAAQVVLAAGCWSSQIPEAASCAPTIPVRGQMVALRHTGKPIRHVLRSEHGYLVPRGERSPQTVVAGSTIENAGYEKRTTSGGLEKILTAANELVPELAQAEIIETWCGLRPGTPDQLPILGPAEIDGLVYATGHYRNGILLAPVTAKLIGEWVADRRTSMDWEAFSPLRFSRAVPGRHHPA
ncbi:MAG TPA: glycine oxidase ThiO, partial [Candidatus Acidoferrales bacterium]|nr:glycine oxidase ThiO [Candidatus Acidoferrales bacterium]